MFFLSDDTLLRFPPNTQWSDIGDAMHFSNGFWCLC